MVTPTKPPDEVLSYIMDHYRYDPLTGYVDGPRKELVGYLTSKKDRYRIAIKGNDYQLTNVCWFLFYGEWPAQEIDHKDRNGLNNAISNLRPSNFSQQRNNADRRIENKYFGVSYHAVGDKWRYRFIVSGKKYEVYGFKTAREAAKAREFHLDQLGDTFCARNKDLG